MFSHPENHSYASLEKIVKTYKSLVKTINSTFQCKNPSSCNLMKSCGKSGKTFRLCLNTNLSYYPSLSSLVPLSSFSFPLLFPYTSLCIYLTKHHNKTFGSCSMRDYPFHAQISSKIHFSTIYSKILLEAAASQNRAAVCLCFVS